MMMHWTASLLAKIGCCHVFNICLLSLGMGHKEPGTLMFDSWLTDSLSELRSKRTLGHSVREQAPKVGSGLNFEEESKETGPGRSDTLGLLLTHPTQPCSGEEGGAKGSRDLHAMVQTNEG